MLIPLILVLIFFALAALLILGWQSVITKAINKYVKPELAKKGFIYRGYQSVEFFGTGDFNRANDDRSTRFPFLYTNGNPSNSLYFYVYYNTPIENKRVTMRIDTTLFFVRQVKFSGEL